MNLLQELENSGVVLRCQCRYGQMFYLTTDHYIGKALNLYGEFSEGEVELFRRLIQPDWTVLDVGANMGAHTVALARLAKFVHAFEPQEILYKILENNVKVNDLNNVAVIWAGVGRSMGRIKVPEVDYSVPGNYGCVAMGTGTKSAPLFSVDSLNLEACHFIKADVEGMELDVVNGALNTLDKFRPILYLENDRDEKSEALIARLFSLCYRVYWHFPPYYNSNNYLRNPQNIYGNTISLNLICIPNEQSCEFPMEITSTTDDWRKRL